MLAKTNAIKITIKVSAMNDPAYSPIKKAIKAMTILDANNVISLTWCFMPLFLGCTLIFFLLFFFIRT